jgi:ribosome-associated protein
MIICTGNSNRHVRSIADNLAEEIRHAGMMPFGVDNNSDGEWVLVDLGEVMVHIMQSDARNLYQLEKLWHSNTKAA